MENWNQEKNKKKKNDRYQNITDTKKIVLDAQLKLHFSGKKSASIILKEIIHSSKQIKEYKAVYSVLKKNSEQISPLEAQCLLKLNFLMIDI